MSNLNLFQKLVEIRKSIDVFKRDKKSYDYLYVSGSQVLSKIKDKMDELGVLLVPKILDQEHETFNYTTAKGFEKTDFLVYGKMTYTWKDSENPDEELEIPFYYTGQQDDISKAFGSGMTYSERYFLMKFFNVPTDDDDPDNRITNNKPTKLASEKQLNFIKNLLQKNVSKQFPFDDLYKFLKEKMGTEKDMENWTVSEAKKAIDILQGKKEG